MGTLENTLCENIDEDGKILRLSLNTTNISRVDCLEDGSVLLVLGGAFAGDVTRYVIFTIMLLFALLTVFGNACIIICVMKSRHLNSTNYSVYVVSLAISDFVVGATCIPALALYTFVGYWPLGSVTCSIFLLCDGICCSVSNMKLNVIAYDRYRAVSDPLTYRSKFTRLRARILATVTWLVGILYYTPMFTVFRALDNIQGILVPGQCYYPPSIMYYIGGILFSTYGPSACLIVLSISLIVSVRRRSKEPIIMRSSMKQKHSQTIAFTDSTLVNSAEREKINLQNRRCLVTLLAQMVLFLICWGPWMFVWPISTFCETCVPPSIYEIAYWMVYLNSTVNPVLYLVFNKDYRNAFQAMLSC